MTQTPSKDSSENTTNGVNSDFHNSQTGLQNLVSNDSLYSHDQQSWEQQKSLGWPQLDLVKKVGQTPAASRRSWFSSLQTKVTALALAIGTLPVVMVGLTGYFVAGQEIQDQVLEGEKTNAVDLEDKLNLFIKQQYDNTVFLSNLNVFANPKVRDLFNRADRDETLNNYLKSFQTYDSIIIYDLKGKILGASEGDYNLDQLSPDYTQAVLKTDRPAIVEPRIAQATGTFSFFVASPVKDTVTGKTIAILRTRVPMAIFQNVFGVTNDRQQKFYVTDSNGQIVAAKRQEALQKQLEKEFPAVGTAIKQSREKVLTTIDLDQKERSVLTYVPNEELAKAYNLKWGVLLSRPANVAFAVERQLLLTMLLGTGVTVLLVGAIATFLANRATRPIINAASAVDKIGQGELDTRLEVEGDDELAVLGSNINQMAAQLGSLLQVQQQAADEQRQLKDEQRQLKEELQQRALELLMEVDPISKGDLTIRAKVTADEIGTIADSYNATVANLRKIVLQVQQAASQVTETTSSNEASVQALSLEALRQAQEIAQALERAQEMAESVRIVAANAAQAEAAVQQAAQTVAAGDQAMNRTVDGILAIRETVAETAKKVKSLGESSQKISTVVSLISNFAAQTNLLALNASIEAARAGEEGRGFAVVADEVRSLARQSAEATSEIEKLVAQIQAETNEVVAAMEAGTEQVVTGTQLVDETRQSLNKISAASSEINLLVEAIAQATIVQAQTSESMTQTMTNVAAIADKTSTEAKQVSSSFEQLLTVAQALQAEVGQFKVS